MQIKVFFIFILLIVTTLSKSVAAEPGGMTIEVDHSKIMQVKGTVADVILGNPSIAEVSILHSNMIVLTGKTNGKTNLIVSSASGSTLMDTVIFVSQSHNKAVHINLAGKKQSYTCNPRCESTLTTSDSLEYFEKIQKQAVIVQKYSCDSPNQRDSAGRRCGARSALTRAGGRPGFEYL